MTMPALESAHCPLGCRDGDDFVVAGYDRLNGGPGEFAIVRCRSCGLMRTNPRPVATAMSDYYPSDYAPYATSVANLGSMPRRPPSAFRRLAVRLLESHSQSLPPLPPGRLLEFGCAAGGFLAHMRALGWLVEGVDISPTATASARTLGLAVHTGALETLPQAAQPYDLVVGWMALEHLTDPLAALRLLHARTRPGGWLAVSVPDAAGLDFRIFGSRCYALQLPTHLFHFTPATLTRQLQAAGWHIQRIQHQRSAGNLVGSIGHLLEDMGMTRAGSWLVRATARSAALHRVLLPVALLLGVLRQSGRMTVWATRDDA